MSPGAKLLRASLNPLFRGLLELSRASLNVPL
jgi:hypothetical protein